MQKTAAQLIAETGVRTLSEKLGVEQTTIRMWKSRNRIPRSAWPDLMDAFPAITIQVLRQTELSETVAGLCRREAAA